MCASVYSILVFGLFTTTLAIFAINCSSMVAEGMPLGRQKSEYHSDLIYGADFLSMLMNASSQKRKSETTLEPSRRSTELQGNRRHQDNEPPLSPKISSFGRSTTESLINHERAQTSEETSKDVMGVTYRTSSSVGYEPNTNPFQHIQSNIIDETTTTELTTLLPTTERSNPQLISEVIPLAAKSSKSELHVEEGEPITRDRESSLNADYDTRFGTKNVSPPHQSQLGYGPRAGFLKENISTTQPLHHTVIYHDQSADPKSARSISYSSIIQNLPQISIETEKPVQHERRERNYNGAQISYVNNVSDNSERLKENTRSFEMQSKDVFSTKTSPITETWQNIDQSSSVTSSTEANWESHGKSYVSTSPKSVYLPKVYGRAEQNYEIDEAVSIETNGRAHGIQPSSPPRTEKKHDDNPKVGYVVEGRNYRKYRVEERTADGFIVGEYGVVSHNDGTLRGVRYTADGTINPRVISEALMKFLSL